MQNYVFDTAENPCQPAAFAYCKRDIFCDSKYQFFDYGDRVTELLKELEN